MSDLVRIIETDGQSRVIEMAHSQLCELTQCLFVNKDRAGRKKMFSDLYLSRESVTLSDGRSVKIIGGMNS